jgi:hypothetical protein
MLSVGFSTKTQNTVADTEIGQDAVRCMAACALGRHWRGWRINTVRKYVAVADP